LKHRGGKSVDFGGSRKGKIGESIDGENIMDEDLSISGLEDKLNHISLDLSERQIEEEVRKS